MQDILSSLVVRTNQSTKSCPIIDSEPHWTASSSLQKQETSEVLRKVLLILPSHHICPCEDRDRREFCQNTRKSLPIVEKATEPNAENSGEQEAIMEPETLLTIQETTPNPTSTKSHQNSCLDSIQSSTYGTKHESATGKKRVMNSVNENLNNIDSICRDATLKRKITPEVANALRTKLSARSNQRDWTR